MYHRHFTLPTALLTAVGLLLAGCGDGTTDDTTGGGPADAPSATGTTTAEFNEADAEFAQAMIGHHGQAVEMAQMVPADGVTPELVELADAVEAAQQPEMDQMTAMLERWGEDPPAAEDPHAGHGSGDTGMGGMMSDEDMDALAAATGVEFEHMWLTMMIEHHQGAVDMAEAELAEGTDAEAQALAQDVVDAQQVEITQMEQMLQSSGS